MLLFASIVRVNDGLALTASTESGLAKNYVALLKQAHPYVKLLSKRIPSYLPRCSLCGDGFTIYFQYQENICCFTICTNSYSYTLAFAFIQKRKGAEFLMKKFEDVLNEFTRVNNRAAVDAAKRAYEYIHFDTYLQRLKSRYNGPTVTNRMSSFMAISDDLTERPPYRIDIDSLEESVQMLIKAEKTSKPTVPPTRRYTQLTLLGGISMLLNAVCAVLNLIRGMHLINEAGFDVEADESCVYLHGLMFLLSAILCLYQIYLLRTFTKFRAAQSFAALILLLFMHTLTSHHRHPLQLLFHTFVAGFTTFHIHARQTLAKLPEYNV